KGMVYGVFALSVFFLALVNFPVLWSVLAVFSAIFFIYVVSFDQFAQSRELLNHATPQQEPQASYQRKISYNALALLIVSVIFLIAGSTIGPKLSTIFSIS